MHHGTEGGPNFLRSSGHPQHFSLGGAQDVSEFPCGPPLEGAQYNVVS